jgi:glycerol-3-phosphate O-acyltransferase / dihydroxyacetone phosphate acyltransferase
VRFILVSSGAIPVHRNPNNLRDASVAGTLRSPANESLFLATSRALAGLRPRGGILNRLVGMFPDRVVGVFPEGTSYTEPYIVQVKEGAAWVALEYSRWTRESGDRDGQPIKIIPVGIAYTDKTQYLSRVSVEQPVCLVVVNCDPAGLCAVRIHMAETTSYSN